MTRIMIASAIAMLYAAQGAAQTGEFRGGYSSVHGRFDGLRTGSTFQLEVADGVTTQTTTLESPTAAGKMSSRVKRLSLAGRAYAVRFLENHPTSGTLVLATRTIRTKDVLLAVDEGFRGVAINHAATLPAQQQRVFLGNLRKTAAKWLQARQQERREALEGQEIDFVP